MLPLAGFVFENEEFNAREATAFVFTQLYGHVKGEVPLSNTQIKAADVILKHTVPRLILTGNLTPSAQRLPETARIVARLIRIATHTGDEVSGEDGPLLPAPPSDGEKGRGPPVDRAPDQDDSGGT